jgi:hypothetical protein
MRIDQRRKRPHALAAIALLGFGACFDEDTASVPDAQTADVQLSVHASSLSAEIGDSITVAVYAKPTGRAVVGALQGYLRYDAARLQFAGQIPDQPGAMVIINESEAPRGVIRLASLHPTGLTDRVATFAFIVSDGAYPVGLRFDPEVVGTVHTEALRAHTLEDARVDGTLPGAAAARRLTYLDWALLADPNAKEPDMLTGLPGEGTRYGDVTLNNVINAFDAADIANVGVGNRELIIATNSVPGNNNNPVDRVTTANVRPQPTATCAAGFDNGTTCTGRTINVFDAQPVAREGVGFAEAVVGDLILLPKATYASGDTVFLAAQTIAGTRTLSNDSLYVLTGLITVGVETGAAGEIVVEPGTRIEGLDTTAIYVTRNGRLIANGTATQPITFTCRNDQRGPGTGRFPQCWGGVFIAGNAVLNEQDTGLGGVTAPAIPGRNPAGGQNQRRGEGGAVNYGGGNDADSSGVIRYARFLYGGRILTANNELNNLTIAACGAGTKLEYIQVHGGSDDGLEIFGGRCNVKYLYATANDDDQFDYSYGYDGSAQFIVVQMTSVAATGGDKGNEVDNTENTLTYNNLPRVSAQVYNLTYVGHTAAQAKTKTAMHYRRGSAGTLRNWVILGAATAFLIDDAATCTLSANQIVLIDVTTQLAGTAACSPSALGPDIATQAASTQLKSPYDVQLADFRPTGTGISPGFSAATPPANGFFDTNATYFGGVAPAGLSGNVVPWYAGWTVGWQSTITP